MKALFLDASTLVMIVTPSPKGRRKRCQDWALDALRSGHRIYIPAIAYYESVRGAQWVYAQNRDREPLDLHAAFVGLPGVTRLALPDAVLDRAAKRWGDLRASGTTLDDSTLSADAIIGTQASMHLIRSGPGGAAVERYIVTENVKHLKHFMAPERVLPFDKIPD